jgi:hypothetical protein
VGKVTFIIEQFGDGAELDIETARGAQGCQVMDLSKARLSSLAFGGTGGWTTGRVRRFKRRLTSRISNRTSSGLTPSRFIMVITVGSTSISSMVGSPDSQHMGSSLVPSVYLTALLQ